MQRLFEIIKKKKSLVRRRNKEDENNVEKMVKILKGIEFEKYDK